MAFNKTTYPGTLKYLGVWKDLLLHIFVYSTSTDVTINNKHLSKVLHIKIVRKETTTKTKQTLNNKYAL